MQALGQGLDLQIRRSCVNQAARLGSGLRSGQIKTHRSIAACYCAAAATKRGAGLTALRNRIPAKWLCWAKKSSCWNRLWTAILPRAVLGRLYVSGIEDNDVRNR